MKDWVYHSFVGNDAHPILVAATRAVVGAFIAGALGFLGAWMNTDEVKALVSAGLIPFFTFLGWRLGVEGLIDVRKRSDPGSKEVDNAESDSRPGPAP